MLVIIIIKNPLCSSPTNQPNLALISFLLCKDVALCVTSFRTLKQINFGLQVTKGEVIGSMCNSLPNFMTI